MPQGLETAVGERGLGLSEGQIQRVAVARALYYGAQVLLLDEATSALDEKTEYKLLQNIKSRENLTCIAITHRKAAEEIADRVLTVTDKKIF